MGYRKISVKRMRDAWEEYKQKCDSHIVVKTEFSQKESRFVTANIPSPITYTIKGFCSFIGLTEAGFYTTYNKDERFKLVIARMKEECENDARAKFETGTIPSQLSGLWMSHYNYTTKTDANVSGSVPVVISGADDLED
jgi:hypothetical protein